MSAAVPAGLMPGGRFGQWDPLPVAFIACDLDGTFLGADERLQPRSLVAVRSVLMAGVRFGFATGRLPAGMPIAALEDSAFAGPHIAHNGAQVLGGGLGRGDALWPLTGTQVDALVDLCAEQSLYGEFYQGGRTLVSTFDERAEPSWRTVTGPPDGLIGDRRRGSAITKATLVAFDPVDSGAALTRVRSRGMTAEVSTAPVFPGAAIVNATAPGVSKGAALAHVLRAVDVPAAAALAIGDGMNDLSMFEVAGTSVAMANAPDAVRARAHLVAPEGDGVAVALRALTGRVD